MMLATPQSMGWFRMPPPTPERLEYLQKWADTKVASKRTRSNDWKDPQSKSEASLIGAIGEERIAFYFSVAQDLRQLGPDHGDGGFDVTIGPWLAGVKTTRIRGSSEVPPGCGLALRPNEKCADLMILCYVAQDLSYVDVAGWVMQRRWEAERVVKDLGYGPRHFMPQENFSNIRDLRAIVGP